MPKCPHCKTVEHVRPSKGSHAMDSKLSRLGLFPFRCDFCRARFYRFAKPGQPVGVAPLQMKTRRPAEPSAGHRKSA